MADGELSGPLSPRLHPDPRHARRPRLRLAMGHADEGYGSDGLDDRSKIRDRLREARPQQAALEADDGSFREAERRRAAAQFVLSTLGRGRVMSEPPVPRFTPASPSTNVTLPD